MVFRLEILVNRIRWAGAQLSLQPPESLLNRATIAYSAILIAIAISNGVWLDQLSP